jgi:hypothetical protein
MWKSDKCVQKGAKCCKSTLPIEWILDTEWYWYMFYPCVSYILTVQLQLQGPCIPYFSKGSDNWQVRETRSRDVTAQRRVPYRGFLAKYSNNASMVYGAATGSTYGIEGCIHNVTPKSSSYPLPSHDPKLALQPGAILHLCTALADLRKASEFGLASVAWCRMW